MKSQTFSCGTLLLLALLFFAGSGQAQERAHDDLHFHDQDQSSFYPGNPNPEDKSDQQRVKPGEKIRVRAAAGYRTDYEKDGYLEGRFHSLEDHVLTMSIDGGLLSIPIDQVYRMEVSQGGGGAWTGVILGLVVGGWLLWVTLKRT